MKSGSHRRRRVFRGIEEATSGGLSQEDLIKNKRGKIVSKKKSSKMQNKKLHPKMSLQAEATRQVFAEHPKNTFSGFKDPELRNCIKKKKEELERLEKLRKSRFTDNDHLLDIE